MSAGIRVRTGMYIAYQIILSAICHMWLTIENIIFGLGTGGTYGAGDTGIPNWLKIHSILINFPAKMVCKAKLSRLRNTGSVLGMDTHADVSCAGMDAYILERLDGRLCEVRGFHDLLKRAARGTRGSSPI